jgi:hypothetical protein
MQMPPMQGPIPTGLHPQLPQPPGTLQQQQAQLQAQQQAQQQQEKLDNISKVKSLVPPLRDSLSVSIFLLFPFYML